MPGRDTLLLFMTCNARCVSASLMICRWFWRARRACGVARQANGTPGMACWHGFGTSQNSGSWGRRRSRGSSPYSWSSGWLCGWHRAARCWLAGLVAIQARSVWKFIILVELWNLRNPCRAAGMTAETLGASGEVVRDPWRRRLDRFGIGSWDRRLMTRQAGLVRAPDVIDRIWSR